MCSLRQLSHLQIHPCYTCQRINSVGMLGTFILSYAQYMLIKRECCRVFLLRQVSIGQQLRCPAIDASGNPIVITASLQRSNGWIAWQVDDWGIFSVIR